MPVPKRVYYFGSRTSWFSFCTYHLYDYMSRYLLNLPWSWWGSVRLHHIMRSDKERALHDHPISFLTILLTGGYWEVYWDVATKKEKRVWRPWLSIRYVPAEFRHRLELERPVWTLVFATKKWREWGFWPHPDVFVHNKNYSDEEYLSSERGSA